MILFDSIVKKDKNYYLQVFFFKKVIKHVTDDLENSSEDSHEE